MNIWFLRMDKDSLDANDLSLSYPFIHSLHGICSDPGLLAEQEELIFPKLKLFGRDLKSHIYSVKKKLIDGNPLNINVTDKPRCDLALRYWLEIMQIGDVVFVRNKSNDLYLCKISSYVQKDFFIKNGCFQRKVTDLQILNEQDIPKEILHRTCSRKTIDRNASEIVKEAYERHFAKPT